MRASLDEMATFVEVVDCGSLSVASKKTGIPKSTVSRRITDLEKRLCVQLLHRTTRNQALTDIGSIYYEHCSRMLSEANAAELAMQTIQEAPIGVLRILSPISLDDPFASKLLRNFLIKYPEIHIEYQTITNQHELSEQHFDCALLMGDLKDSSLVAKRFGTFRHLYCASPAYIEAYGIPKDEIHLSDHFFATVNPLDWITVKKDPLEGKIKSRFTTNDYYSLRRTATDGMCIARLPEIQIFQQLKDGDLIEVLPHLATVDPMYLVFPKKKQYTTKLRVFLEHAVSHAAKHAPWKFN